MGDPGKTSRIGPVLVTGAYGLIGHEVVLRLDKYGVPTVATDALETRPADAAFTAVPLTVSGVDALAAVFRAHRCQAVVHAAGISGPMLARDDPHRVVAVNACGTFDLLEAARRTGVARVVLLSSASVYGATDDHLVAEDTPLRATGIYASSKIAAEAVGRAYAFGPGPEVVILRPSWVYGPRRRTPCVIRTMIAGALARSPVRLPWGSGFPRQFVEVSDVADAVVAALGAPGVSGRAFNLADGTRPTIDAVADLVRTVFPEADIALEAGPDPDDDVLGPLDISAAREALGWRPSIPLVSGMRSLAALLGQTGPP